MDWKDSARRDLLPGGDAEQLRRLQPMLCITGPSPFGITATGPGALDNGQTVKYHRALEAILYLDSVKNSTFVTY